MQRIHLMLDKFELLKNDFIGVTFNFGGFFRFFELIIFTIFIFFFLHAIGEKIRSRFLKGEINDKFINHFINIAVGYIFFATGIYILGIFSLLTPIALDLYLLLIFVFCIFHTNLITKLVVIFSNIGSFVIEYAEKDYKVALVVGVLVFITFLRLIPPETGADALDYHTSYPRFYLKNHSMMLEPIATEGAITVPQLGEMLYIVPEFFGLRDASRFIHFTFYLCIIALFFHFGSKNNKFKYASIIFASAPLVLHIVPSAYGDMPATFLFLLSVAALVAEKKHYNKNILLSGILFGGFLASKIWALAFLPIFVTYFAVESWKASGQSILKRILLFVLVSLFLPTLWYLRSFVLTGNPLYFNQDFNQDVIPHAVNFKRIFPYNIYSTVFNFSAKFRKDLLFDYGPILLLGFVAMFNKPMKLLRENLSSPYWNFTLVMIVIYLLLPHSLYDPRYLLPFYSLFSLILSVGINQFILTNNIFRYIAYSIIVLLLGYYSLNSFVYTIYGFGWANTENYLTRFHLSIPTSYYDFDHKFSKLIRTDETVATYGISMYYYADFNYKHVFYFFKDKRKLEQLREAHLSKLLIRGGDMEWFCQQLQVLDCDVLKYKQLASFIQAKQYLYEIMATAK